MDAAFYLAVLVMIVARTTNMWAHAPTARPFLRAFRKEAVLFRTLVGVTGVAIGLLSLGAGAWGHGAGNLYLALVAALNLGAPASPLRPLVVLLGAPALRWLGVVAAAALTLALTTEAPWPQALNAAGAWLMVSAFSAMLAERWGPDSSGAAPYVGLCLAFDGLLLASALWLGVLPLVLLEVYALGADVVKAGQLRPASAGN